MSGIARTSGTDGPFDVREDAELVPEEQRVWFHRIVAKLSYLTKRATPECLTAVALLTTRVTKCVTDDRDKLN